MKRFGNYFLLGLLALVSVRIIWLRFQGAAPTQLPDTVTILVLLVNALWIGWVSQKTRKERS